MKIKKITVPFDEREYQILRETASADGRNPRNQARFLILYSLGLADIKNSVSNPPLIEQESSIDEPVQTVPNKKSPA